MGDTAEGNWGSRELGGYIRRQEAREWPSMRPDEVVPFLLRVLVHIALERQHLGIGREAYEAAYDAVSDAAVAVEREIAHPGAS